MVGVGVSVCNDGEDDGPDAVDPGTLGGGEEDGFANSFGSWSPARKSRSSASACSSRVMGFRSREDGLGESFSAFLSGRRETFAVGGVD